MKFKDNQKMLWCCIIICCGLFMSEKSALSADSIVNNYVLVWGDEFNYVGVPDVTKWGHETGFIRNEEDQYYTPLQENVRIENGNLILEAHKKEYKNKLYDAMSEDWRLNRAYAKYTSGSVLTRGLMEFKYGRLEIRAKLPYGVGVWPAAWTTGANISSVGWPACGEIDIMEHIGREPGTIFFGLHYQGGKSMGKYTAIIPQEYHIYAIEWKHDYIRFYIDKVLVKTFNIDDAGTGPENPFRQDHILRLNLAIGGTWGGAIDASIFPVRYVIDYVRLYAEKQPSIFPGVYLLLNQ